MKLGLNVGYWMGGLPEWAPPAIAEAEKLGLDSVWTAESYGSDALTPLAWWGAHTQKLRLGTAIMQIPARTPAATAMAAMSMDHLSGGRFCLGVGASGPQVVEGWHGQPFAKPLGRSREYIQIVRRILEREAPVDFEGEHYSLPYTGAHPPSTGLGKPLKANVHPLRPDLPIFLGAEGPKNIALAAELCDGWLALFYSPHHQDFYDAALAEGFARDGSRRTADDFEIVASAHILINDDVEAAADMMRPMYALYFGGMGSRNKNFHADVARRMGYEAEVDTIQDLYLSGKKDEAAAAVPTKLIEQLALIGPRDKVKHDLEAWRDSPVTTLLVHGDASALPALAELVLG